MLSFIGLQEAELNTKLENLQEELKKAKIYLHEQYVKLSSSSQGGPPYEDIRGRIDQVLKVVELGQSSSRGVLGDFTKIHQKLIANRVDKTRIDKVYEKIVRPLEDLVPVEFSECEDLLRNSRTGLEEDASQAAKNLASLPQRIQDTVDSEKQLDQIMKKLNDVIQVMRQEVKFAQLLETANFASCLMTWMTSFSFFMI